jgi:hypothetical protein
MQTCSSKLSISAVSRRTMLAEEILTLAAGRGLSLVLLHVAVLLHGPVDVHMHVNMSARAPLHSGRQELSHAQNRALIRLLAMGVWRATPRPCWPRGHGAP